MYALITTAYWTHLHVQMYDTTAMHVVNSLAYLPDEALACLLRQDEIFAYDSVKKLSTVNAAKITKMLIWAWDILYIWLILQGSGNIEYYCRMIW